MKKTSGLIALIILLVTIFLGLGYKMIEPDGWDRFVEDLIPSRAENDHGDLNVKNESADTPEAPIIENSTENDSQTGSESVRPDKKPSNPATPKPTATPTPTPSATPAPSEPPVVDENMTYEKYIALSGADQQSIFESFENPQDFFDWYNAAKEEYDKAHEDIIINGGSIDLEDYIKE